MNVNETGAMTPMYDCWECTLSQLLYKAFGIIYLLKAKHVSMLSHFSCV